VVISQESVWSFLRSLCGHFSGVCVVISQESVWSFLNQPLRWCCVDSVICHERDVREEQKYIRVVRASNSKRDCDDWSLLLLAATVRSFAHMPLEISDRNKVKTWVIAMIVIWVITMVGSMIVAGVWTGVGFSNLKNCRIQKCWNRSGVGVWKSYSGVKRNFWPQRNFWPFTVCQLFCFSE